MKTKILVFCMIGVLSVFGMSSVTLAQHTGDPQGGLLYEPWPSLTPDATWRLQTECYQCTDKSHYTSVSEVFEYEPGEFAYKSRGPDTWWETTGDIAFGFMEQNRFYQFVLGNDMFTRGDDLRCRFTFWGDPADPAWAPENFGPNGPIAWPQNSGVIGPFHRTSGMDIGPPHPPGSTGAIHAGPEAGIETNLTGRTSWKFMTSGLFNTAIFDDEHGTFGNLGTNQPFLDAIESSTCGLKDCGVILEVWLGDTDGAMVQYSTVSKGTFIEIFDNRNVGSDPNPQEDVWIGFGSDLGALLVDDIIVEDNNNLWVSGPSDTPTPSPSTPTPNPVSGVKKWEQYE